MDSQVGQSRGERELYLSLALDATSAHVAILDENGAIIGVNAAWREFVDDISFDHADSGVGLKYLAFCDRTAMYRPTHALQVASGISDVISGKRDCFEMEYPCNIFKDQYWYVLSASRFNFQDQKRILIVHQDITDLKHAQLELAESRRKIRSALDKISSGVFTVTSDGAIESCNPAAEHIFGYPHDELPGMKVAQLVGYPGLDGDGLRDSNMGKRLKMLGKRRDGSEFPMYVRIKKDQAEDRRWYTIVVQDRSDGKRVKVEPAENERLLFALRKKTELQDSRNRFLAMMSHELRTPLASIRLSHDMLAQYGAQASNDEKRLYLENIKVQVDHVKDILGDVMSLTAPETRALDFSPQRSDLITFCRDIIESFQINHHHTHHIAFACLDDEIIARFDRRLLRRALSNLLDNAIKYSPNGGHVEFDLRRDNEQALISVSDEGIGIPPEDVDALFDAFQRSSNVGSVPGTGLGLAIAKQAIEQHGGRIALLQPGAVGATFCIDLPLNPHLDNSRD